MLISQSKKFIFIHIYKTAGTSVREQFISHARLIDRLAYEYKPSMRIYRKIRNLMQWQYGGMKQFTGYHKHEKAYNIKNKLGEKYESYFKFSFVRNPYDFIVSLYFFILATKNHRYHEDIKNKNFDEFVKYYISLHPPLQTDFLMDESRKSNIVDYIGRFENLQRDINEIKQLVGIKKEDTIKHRNESVKRGTKEYVPYYKTFTKNLVKVYFEKDLDLLGYDFEGPIKEVPLSSL